MRRIRFRDHACESDVCLWAIETAIMLLEREAGEKPVRVIVSSTDDDLADRIKEGIAKARAMFDVIERLKVVVDLAMPADEWYVQGKNAEIYSEGA